MKTKQYTNLQSTHCAMKIILNIGFLKTTYNSQVTLNYGTAQFKIDTRVQQTRMHLTDFVEAHASYSHAGCMAREHICTIEYTARERAYTRHDMRELRHEAHQKPIARKQMHSRG